MTRRRIQPFRQVSPLAIRSEGWAIQIGTGDLQELPDYLPSWDYASNISLTLDIEINVPLVLEDTGIDSLDAVGIVVVAECPVSGLRLTELQELQADVSQYRVTLRVEPGQFAQEFIAWCGLVLQKEMSFTSSDVPFRAGSRLLISEPRRVVLEGEAARFPSEAVSFEALGWDEALWKMQTEIGSLDDQFNGTVRLYLNSDFREAKTLAEGEEPTILSKFLEVDVARSIFRSIARIDPPELLTDDELELGTVGQVADSLARGLLHSDLSSCIEMIRTDPQGFEVLLQSRYQPWRNS